jgi:hypothetical protein
MKPSWPHILAVVVYDPARLVVYLPVCRGCGAGYVAAYCSSVYLITGREARLPGLIAAFRADMTAAGLLWEPGA